MAFEVCQQEGLTRFFLAHPPLNTQRVSVVPRACSPVALVIHGHKVHEKHVVSHGVHSKKLHLEGGEHSSGVGGREVRSPQGREYRTDLCFTFSGLAAPSSTLLQASLYLLSWLSNLKQALVQLRARQQVLLRNTEMAN